MTAPWTKALDAQLDLIGRWQGSGALTPAEDLLEYLELPVDGAEAMARGMSGSLDEATTYWTSGEMTRFLTYSQQDFPDQRLTTSMLPSQHGFVYFDESVKVDVVGGEGDDRAVSFTALHWVWAGDEQDGFLIITGYSTGAEVKQATKAAGVKGMDLGSALYPIAHASLGHNDAPVDTLQRLLMAFWALIGQRVTDTTRMPIERHARRRAERRGKQNIEDGIRVIRLRRLAGETPSDHDDKLVMWSHRWVVGGHWRQQWYPSADEHRPIWIAPHVKGPESAPLVLKDRIYRVDR